MHKIISPYYIQFSGNKCTNNWWNKVHVLKTKNNTFTDLNASSVIYIYIPVAVVVMPCRLQFQEILSCTPDLDLRTLLPVSWSTSLLLDRQAFSARIIFSLAENMSHGGAIKDWWVPRMKASPLGVRECNLAAHPFYHPRICYCCFHRIGKQLVQHTNCGSSL